MKKTTVPLMPKEEKITNIIVKILVRRIIANLGVNLFILGFADEPAMTGIELFIREVMPHFEEIKK